LPGKCLHRFVARAAQAGVRTRVQLDRPVCNEPEALIERRLLGRRLLRVAPGGLIEAAHLFARRQQAFVRAQSGLLFGVGLLDRCLITPRGSDRDHKQQSAGSNSNAGCGHFR